MVYSFREKETVYSLGEKEIACSFWGKENDN